MTAPLTVCILTSGKGTRMGPYANVINKALLPYQGRAILSHLIECFPQNTRFVIALGYLGEQVKSYVRMAHPNLRVEYVVTTAPSSNWVGVAQVTTVESAAYCNFEVHDGKVRAIMDKETCPEPCFAYSGLLYVRDPEIFWPALAHGELRAGEHQISNGMQGLLEKSGLFAAEVPWTDVGTFERYRSVAEASTAYDFGKTDEFLYHVNGRIVKFFKDPAVAANRVRKAALKPEVFPPLVDTSSQFYAYDFVPGQNLYQRSDPQLFRRLLNWLSSNLWTPVEIAERRMSVACRQFYHEKTLHRLAGSIGRASVPAGPYSCTGICISTT
jgi:dTDP-glucose pyrophosphorylase